MSTPSGELAKGSAFYPRNSLENGRTWTCGSECGYSLMTRGDKSKNNRSEWPMFHLTSKPPKFTLEMSAFQDDLNKVMRECIQAIARQWLRAMVERVPSSTGMARGSLIPLGHYLQQPIAIQIKPGRKSRVSLGMEAGEVEVEETYSSVRLRWEADVPHWRGTGSLQSLEYYANPMGGHPAWNSLVAGEAAVESFAKPYIAQRIRPLADHFTWRTEGGLR